MRQQDQVPQKRPTVSREIGTSLLLSVPMVVAAELIARALPVGAFDSLPIENFHGTRRFIAFFVLGYLFAVPCLVRRINLAAAKQANRTRDIKFAGVLLAAVGPITALPALLLWLGPSAATGLQKFYFVAVHHWLGLWLIGAVLCFSTALVIWLIAYALNLDSKN